jgi:hypothetical protein
MYGRPPFTRRHSPPAVALLALLALGAGCTPAHYRRQADCEVYQTVDCFDRNPRWHIDDYSIRPNPASRMFDPDDPDCPPMPADDPASHRLMECPDCKRGWPHWHRNGDTLDVQNPCWRAYLPYNEQGQLVLDREGVVALAFLNSREYQQELEDLYLSALDVTFQRFRFDTHFYARHLTRYTAEGPLYGNNHGASSSTLEVNNVGSLSPSSTKNLEAKKLLATGGTLAVGLANQLVWQFAGPNEYSTATLVDFELVQPLLRGAGRAVALEGLTAAERTLLANVRQMVRYRQAFWVNLMNGRSLPNGPNPNGIPLSALTPIVTSTAIAGTGSTTTNGLLGLLAEEQSIRNQRANISALRTAVDQLETTYQAGRIDRYQVDLTRQSLISAQSRLLSLIKSHDDRLDAYKIQLGLPPSLNVRFEDPLLSRFNMIDPELTAVADRLESLLDQIRDLRLPGDDGQLAAWSQSLGALREAAMEQVAIVARDLEALDAAAPQRRADLAALADREEIRRDDVETKQINAADFNTRLAAIHQNAEAALVSFREAVKAIETFLAQPPAADRVQRRDQLEQLALRLALRLSDLSLTQARARAETLTLVPVDLDPGEALEVAREHRLDWMNARAALVDVWRQIQIKANALRSDLDVTLSGDMGTIGNNPLRFRSATGRLRAGLQFDTPLTRLEERNAYREALIEYQRARRAYYAYEDKVSQSLRTTLAAIRLDRLNFELRRTALLLAIGQVEIMRLRITRPPKPGEATTLGATTANDLVTSLNSLLNAQDGILSVWIDYENQRMNLDLELGTFRFNDRAMWDDPGPLEAGTLPKAEREEPLPEPIPLPPATNAT